MESGGSAVGRIEARAIKAAAAWNKAGRVAKRTQSELAPGREPAPQQGGRRLRNEPKSMSELLDGTHIRTFGFMVTNGFKARFRPCVGWIPRGASITRLRRVRPG